MAEGGAQRAIQLSIVAEPVEAERCRSSGDYCASAGWVRARPLILLRQNLRASENAPVDLRHRAPVEGRPARASDPVLLPHHTANDGCRSTSIGAPDVISVTSAERTGTLDQRTPRPCWCPNKAQRFVRARRRQRLGHLFVEKSGLCYRREYHGYVPYPNAREPTFTQVDGPQPSAPARWLLAPQRRAMESIHVRLVAISIFSARTGPAELLPAVLALFHPRRSHQGPLVEALNDRGSRFALCS